MKKLQSMVQFVLDESLDLGIGGDTYKDFHQKVKQHAQLLSQQPNIGMFVPAVCENGVWRVLEEPTVDAYMQPKEMDKQYAPYQQAKSKVIFKGWEKTDCKGFDLVRNHVLLRLSDYNTLEDLVKFNLEMV